MAQKIQRKTTRVANLELSIVLPTYQERDNLAILIPKLEEGFRSADSEIIIVDDNSNDGTETLVNNLNKQFGNVRLIIRPSLRGVGSAIRDGYNAAKGNYILSADADLSLAVSDMVRLYEKIREGFDMVVGYRYGPHGFYETKSLAIKMKRLVSKPGSFLIRMLTGIKLRDFSNNSRIMKRDRWLELKTYEDSNAFLFEVILKAARNGFKIAEIPISFHERKYGSSKLVLWKETPRSLLKLLKYTLFDR